MNNIKFFDKAMKNNGCDIRLTNGSIAEGNKNNLTITFFDYKNKGYADLIQMGKARVGIFNDELYIEFSKVDGFKLQFNQNKDNCYCSSSQKELNDCIVGKFDGYYDLEPTEGFGANIFKAVKRDLIRWF